MEQFPYKRENDDALVVSTTEKGWLRKLFYWRRFATLRCCSLTGLIESLAWDQEPCSYRQFVYYCYQSASSDNDCQQIVNLVDLLVEPAPDVGRYASGYGDLWCKISNRIVTNNFHTTDYESAPFSSSSRLLGYLQIVLTHLLLDQVLRPFKAIFFFFYVVYPMNLLFPSNALLSMSAEATYGLNDLSDVPATSGCLNSQG
nr:hypothetical protein [Tanacetum cinerariifolium]